VLLRPPPENALQEWIVSQRVNCSGVGGYDPSLIKAERIGAPKSA
jgi:hypothetical protein